MKLRDEYWVLTRDTQTGKVVGMTRLPLPEVEFYEAEAGIRSAKECRP